MENIELVQELLKKRADYQARINLIPVDGSLEIKTIEGEDYIYARKRVAGKNTSTYIGKYDEAVFQSLQRQLAERRQMARLLRQTEKELAALGYEDKRLEGRVILNIDFARANVKTLIYDQAILEGISTTFPQTEEVLENGTVHGLTASDVQKILNLKRAWEFILNKDVLGSPSGYYLLSYIAGMINEGFYSFGGSIRGVPVRIGGSTYVPPLPLEQDVKENIQHIVDSGREAIEIAIDLALFCMKTQVFIDGNKRAAIIFANHYLISKGQGLLVVPESLVPEFKSLLIAFYEGRDAQQIKGFLRDSCWMQF